MEREVTIAGFPYTLKGALARGDDYNVFCGYRKAAYPELVVVKEALTPEAGYRLEQSHHRLRYLTQLETQGADVFGRYLPQPVSAGPLADALGPRGYAAVYRWRSGFLCTLGEVKREHPEGVSGRTLVWIIKRCLAQAGFLAENGYAHGNLEPNNILIHPRDHGAVFCGYSRLNQLAYEEEDLGPLRTALRTLIGPATDTRAVEVFLDPSAARGRSAWNLVGELTRRSEEVYGPPAYEPLNMPGW